MISRMDKKALAERSRRATTVAVAAGRALGLSIDKPLILHDVFSLVVHLAPLPVVARVPLVLPPGLRGWRQLERMQRELDVVAWLAARRFPVVPPSPLVPRAPVECDGLQITFWELADVADDHVPYGGSDLALTAQLHAELREYPERLPFLAPIAHTVPQCIAALETEPQLMTASDLEKLKREWGVLGPILTSEEAFLDRFPRANIQTIHGDAPSHNVIRTRSGIRMADFEDVTRGPIEFELTMMPPEDVQRYNQEAHRLGLPTTSDEVLAVMNHARMLQMVGSTVLIPQLPLLEEGLKSSIEMWREMQVPAGLA